MQLIKLAVLATSLLSDPSAAIPTPESYEVAAAQFRPNNPISDKISWCMFPVIEVCIPQKGSGPQDVHGCILEVYNDCSPDKGVLTIEEEDHHAFTKDVRVAWMYCRDKEYRAGTNAREQLQACKRRHLSEVLSKHLGIARLAASELTPEEKYFEELIQDINRHPNLAMATAANETAKPHQLVSRQSEEDTHDPQFKKWYHCAQHRWNCYRKSYQFDCEESKKECSEDVDDFQPLP